MKTNQMVVLLTGACGGIGQEIAKQLAAEGASLYLMGRDEKRLTALKESFQQNANKHQFIEVSTINLLDDKALTQLPESLATLDKPINVVINNAGIMNFDLFENVDMQDIEKVISLNTIATIKLTHVLLPQLKQQAQARIINVASTFAAIGFPGYSIYSASKFAIRGFSEALNRELSDTHVSVGCFLPRATKTPINSPKAVAMNKKLNVSMDTPEFVARSLLTFISNNQSFKALGWPEKLLVKINSLFPSIINFAIKKQLSTIKHFAA